MKGVFAHWPNRITAIRFIGALILFAVLESLSEESLSSIDSKRFAVQCAFWLFVVVAATDFLDGYLARKHKQVSNFGRIADPFTDKVLILGAMIYAAVMPWTHPWMPAWIVVVILARELLVTGLRGYVEKLGGEFPADRWGKIKMIVQCMAVGGVIWLEAYDWPDAWYSFWSGLTYFLVWTTLFATLGSGLNYVVHTAQFLKGHEQD
ncbi:MAG: CDP-diacylglycerol--glycerol-3-phosphate 3-phosphatidyltransferase [Planctomycetes bacterium]|nr:CDP-diacylglycerol--glycerol-3-phosphate 3-phosphatidyltransferase [Planctomycetota bacterium]